VRSETSRYLDKFRKHPSDFNNSEAYFRILTMITVLQQDFGAHYAGEQIETADFTDPDAVFISGLVGPKRKGTCVSMPVLYVAIGRSLGYPLKVVTTKAHLFARWESSDGKERFNIEATNQGLNCFSDDYYRTWPVPITEEEVQSCGYLKSLSPAEELAVFLSVRGHCLEAVGKLPEAQLAHAQAHVLAPNSSVYLAFLASAIGREMPEWRRVQVDLGAVGQSSK
jgi:regulator of sirC expression with transglutaminase-like and TPR domain